MKTALPDGHGLADRLLRAPLIHGAEGAFSLTDIQYAALSQGVGCGRSAIVIAPTSSGKTEVGLYAAAMWLESGDRISRKVSYLVSHRALARQKYLELRSTSMLEALQIDAEQLVLATGDEVIDGTGEANQDPLDSTFIVATYEKFLALLAGSGLRQDMSHYCIVADEVQLVADEGRGQDIEILLTLIKAAGCGQFIGLSAVLHKNDYTHLADWLGLNIVREINREVPLQLELHTTAKTYAVTLSDQHSDHVGELAPDSAIDTLSILLELAKKPHENYPIAVFCMTKRRVEELARAWGSLFAPKANAAISQQLELFDEASGFSGDLLAFVGNNFGVHTADLLETERAFIENQLDLDNLSVVFATTTLAQGMNYSFQTVVFDDWTRYNFSKKVREGIPKAEFHNMAGRAGRLGKSARALGRAIYSSDARSSRAAQQYLSLDTEVMLSGRIDPTRFDQLALQIISASIVDSEEALLTFLEQTLSAHIARFNNRALDDVWRREMNSALGRLHNSGFLTL